VPYRAAVSRELVEPLGVLACPHGPRILEALREGELGVGARQEVLQISRSGVPQHRSPPVRRAHRPVVERRAGRHVFYRLRDPELAVRLLTGLECIEGDAAASQQLRRDARRAEWSAAG
jgi:DNA-binding transcriptional ArsR family regulator